jgi:hypothetical protein
MNTPPTFRFRWRSLLGLAVALFLFYGAMNILLPIYVPLSLHLRGPWSVGGLVLTNKLDQALLGQFAAASQTDPRFVAFLVSYMDTMCAFMMAFALLPVAVVWFALRRGQAWALWAAALADLAILPYYTAIAQTYVGFGVMGAGQFLRGIAIFAALVLAATASGWFGLRRSGTV